MKKIYFHNLYPVRLENRTLLKQFLSNIFKKEGRNITRIDIIFCSDVYLLSLNNRFLKHDYFTDTLTFTLSPDPIIGEIYISVERVRDNSKRLNIRAETELFRVIIHSCLHLCGYKDSSRIDSSKMFRIQEKYLKDWLVSRETKKPYTI